MSVARLIAIIALMVPATIGGLQQAHSREPDAIKVLFVGNSLIYSGNLPAVLDSLRGVAGARTTSDMIVAPGATLTDRLEDGAVARALRSGSYRFVVLQERGGDFACGLGPQVCANSRRSLAVLNELIRSHGATPILLGTYQGSVEAARRTIDAERESATETRMAYVRVADRLLALRDAHPTMAWFASDGMHPGPDLTLLNAVLLFREIHGANPRIVETSVQAPIFSFRSPIRPDLRHSGAATEIAGTPLGATYGADRMAVIASVQ